MTVKKESTEHLKVASDTWIRTIVLAFTLINQVAINSNRDMLPWSENYVYAFLSTCATVFVSGWTYWKNNSWTRPALKGDEVMQELKSKT